MKIIYCIFGLAILFAGEINATSVTPPGVNVAVHRTSYEASLPEPFNALKLVIIEREGNIAQLKIFVNHEELEINQSVFPLDFKYVLPSSFRRTRLGSKSNELTLTFEYGLAFNYVWPRLSPSDDDEVERLKSVFEVTINDEFEIETEFLFQKPPKL